MLAVIGFITTALLLAIFAAVFDDYVVGRLRLGLHNFSTAFYLLAATFLTWGTAAMFNTTQSLQFGVVAGDAILLAATIFMAGVIVPPRYRRDVTILGVIIASWLLAFRVVQAQTVPFVQDGVLVLNPPTNVAVVTVVGLLLFWLPACLRVSGMIAAAVKQRVLQNIYSSMYTIAILSGIVFVAAQRRSVVIAAFILFSFVILLLIYSTVVTAKLLAGVRKHAK